VLVSEVSIVAKNIQSGIDSVGGIIAGVDPALVAPVGVAELLANLAAIALTAYSAASGVPITIESVQALLPNATPLTAPTS
jgi:hypothetical protein